MAEEEIQDAELVEDDTPDAIFEPAMAGPFTMVQAMAFGLVILLLSSTVLYYVFSSEEVVELEVVEPEYNDPRVFVTCLLYTSPSPRDRQKSRMPSSA